MGSFLYLNLGVPKTLIYSAVLEVLEATTRLMAAANPQFPTTGASEELRKPPVTPWMIETPPIKLDTGNSSIAIGLEGAGRSGKLVDKTFRPTGRVIMSLVKWRKERKTGSLVRSTTAS
ncbi:hypothetical protein BO83DRAFT_416668 [Aspergillus eucalypticola CBS 122712]|uniref:Uncharacterized protein n=1 Tax=Aspergillus eucalypticola (strain CBS 122712 / IBT 29274) TaxID=1448314 RepID=A0A317VP20_ASPEC|nr:uncharacterized protein BO83DRAFT_416668 [Aspergillus eucalypticola CBS 122712]PWY74817.1 hypothetical protein BO83DRAFT_416668 [Aspergillus eucalypticola CBS 122712]